MPATSPTLIRLSSRRHQLGSAGEARARPGVLVPLAPPQDFALRDRLRAEVALAGRTRPVLFGAGAAWALTAGRVALPPLVTVAVPPGANLGRPGLTQVRLADDEITEVDGLRCTTPLRTAFDLLRLSARRMAVPAVDALANLFCLRTDDLLASLLERPRQRGNVQAKALLAEVEPNAQSVPESLLRLLLVDGGLPRPVAQLIMLDNRGGFLGRCDLGYETVRLALEYLGRVHALTLDADWERQNAVSTSGWLSLGVTSAAMRTPDRLLERVVAAGRHQHDVLGLAGAFCLA